MMDIVNFTLSSVAYYCNPLMIITLNNKKTVITLIVVLLNVIFTFLWHSLCVPAALFIKRQKLVTPQISKNLRMVNCSLT